MPMMGQPRGGPSLSQLVAPNRALPAPRPQGQVVGAPQALPGLIPYGPQPQGLVQSSRFTGGSVPGGGMSLTHPEMQTPTFQEPQFSMPAQALGPAPPPAPPHPIASILALAALTGAIGGHPPSGAPPGQPPFHPAQRAGQTPAPDRAPASPGQFPLAPRTDLPSPDATRSVAAPGQFPLAPRTGPLTSLAALLANPAVGRRGVYGV